MLLLELIVLVFFTIVLAKATHLVIDNAVKISEFFRIGQAAVGFILVSTATSLPELAVSVISGSQKQGAIALGNVFGSNIANVLLVLGTAAFFYVIKVKKIEIHQISIILLIVSLITIGVITTNELGVSTGLLLLATFAVYVMFLLKQNMGVDRGNHVTRKEALVAFLLFSVGIAAVLVSASFIVESAVKIAEEAGLAKSFIGATIIAVGTSLPEIAVDFQAIRKKKYGLALGDAIGSSMANITLVLGTAAVLGPITFNKTIFGVFALFAIVTNVFLVYFLRNDNKLTKKEAIIFLFLYALYMMTIFQVQLTIRD